MRTNALTKPRAGLSFETVNGEPTIRLVVPEGQQAKPGETIRIWASRTAILRLRDELDELMLHPNFAT